MPGVTDRQRGLLVLLILCVVLAVINKAIWDKEQILAHGQQVFLELAPADPRSLMQGDYMRLRYALENEIDASSHQRHGFLILKVDQGQVARFLRFDRGEVLTKGEFRLPYHHRGGHRIRISPDSFFFQEGLAEYFEDARYGVFRVSSEGESLLVALADEHRQLIQPPVHVSYAGGE